MNGTLRQIKAILVVVTLFLTLFFSAATMLLNQLRMDLEIKNSISVAGDNVAKSAGFYFKTGDINSLYPQLSAVQQLIGDVVWIENNAGVQLAQFPSNIQIGSPPCSNAIRKPIFYAEELVGRFGYCIPATRLMDSKIDTYIFVIFLLLFSLVATVIFRLLNYALHDTQALIGALSNMGLENPNLKSLEVNLKFPENKQIIEKVESLISKVVVATQLADSARAKGELLEFASQVSHDIRSPLSALNVIVGTLGQLPEDKRILIRSACNRINDIANQLLQKAKRLKLETNLERDSAAFSDPNNDLAGSHFLHPLVDQIVSEKRVQYRDRQGIEIEADLANCYGVFIKINATELKRALSNLINNSIEAFPSQIGKISIVVRNEDPFAVILVQDNGVGIPPEHLRMLGNIGASFGKPNGSSGNGLGVAHAMKTVKEANGEFEILSKKGRGTEVILKFKKSLPPTWFLSQLPIFPGTRIVSVDDDISIHQLWKDRLSDNIFKDLRIQHLTFTSAIEFKNWKLSQNAHGGEIANSSESDLYLVDYEFLNQPLNGFKLIEELAIADRSVLVTSRFDEPDVLANCERLGVKLLPKTLSNTAPISIQTKPHDIDCVLVDDDHLVRTMWAMSAKELNKSLLLLSSNTEFLEIQANLRRDIDIYFDVDLGGEQDGTRAAERAYHLGFQNIHLATGYPQSNFDNLKFLKSIVGKDPVWLR
jgi:signal transduction histidine kinase